MTHDWGSRSLLPVSWAMRWVVGAYQSLTMDPVSSLPSPVLQPPCSIARSRGSYSNSDNTKALVEQATVKGWRLVPVSTSSSQGQETGARLSDLPASGRARLRPRPTTHGDGQTKGSESLPVPTCIQSRAIGRGGPLEGKCRHLGWPPRRVITTSC